MTRALYEASVPVFLRYLDRLLGMVDAAESHARSHRIDESEILLARLAPDMLPFERQVVIAANFSLRAAYPLAGREIPPFPELACTFNGAREHVSRVVVLLQSLAPRDFENRESAILNSQAGNALVSLKAPEFLFQYALPNFFFHVSVAYSILRHVGVGLGKEHFDGWHSYPAGPGTPKQRT